MADKIQEDLEREIADLERQLRDAKDLLKHANPSDTYEGLPLF
jgi:hypothetical protein